MGLLDFEAFQLKDWWRKAKDSPEQLLFGAADPFSAKLLSKATGKEYEPFVDQMGGPYGGSALSVGGNTDGGVYGRAEEAGINTKPARNAHNAAHAVAAFYALGGGAGAGGGTGGGAGGGGAGSSSLGNPWMTNFWGTPGQSIPGISGEVSTGTGIYGGFGGMGGGAGASGGGAGLLGGSGGGMEQYAQLAQGLLGGGQEQQQQPQIVVAPQGGQQQNLVMRAQMARNQRAQELRRKTNRTPEEEVELRELTRSSLLG